MTPRYPERTGVFAGTFNPFTIGHASIVRRALEMFDHIIICVGYNINKADDPAATEARVEAIRKVYATEPRVSVEAWGGLTSEFALQRGAAALVRGVRSVKDFEYERDLADANRKLGGIDTVMLVAEPDVAWVSSSLVRELRAHGKDVSTLLP